MYGLFYCAPNQIIAEVLHHHCSRWLMVCADIEINSNIDPLIDLWMEMEQVSVRPQIEQIKTFECSSLPEYDSMRPTGEPYGYVLFSGADIAALQFFFWICWDNYGSEGGFIFSWQDGKSLQRVEDLITYLPQHIFSDQRALDLERIRLLAKQPDPDNSLSAWHLMPDWDFNHGNMLLSIKEEILTELKGYMVERGVLSVKDWDDAMNACYKQRVCYNQQPTYVFQADLKKQWVYVGDNKIYLV